MTTSNPPVPDGEPEKTEPVHGSREAHESSNQELPPLRPDTQEIICRLKDRRALMDAAISTERLSDGAGVVLQAGATEVVLQAGATEVGAGQNRKQVDTATSRKSTPKDVTEAVNYRLAITDLFVEKAQYHLERRARHYEILGYALYSAAVVLFGSGACVAVSRMYSYDKQTLSAVTASVPPSDVAPTPAVADSTHAWIELLRRFVLAFTAYGLIVLTAVALARGARACLDQRERLLAKRHSLRQGRLYLHLSGGRLTIEDMERAFNWNHEQHNAFTHMATDAKAPWGAVLEEIVKITPELIKAGATATREATDKKNAADSKDRKGS